MLKLFIDTSQPTFCATLFNQDYQVIEIVEKQTKYKVEEIINFFNKIDCIDRIKTIYINLGPGSFTGCRIALLYIRTIIQIYPDIKLWTTNTFFLLPSKQKQYIYATKNKAYCFDGKKIKMVETKEPLMEINYQHLVHHFQNYLKFFQLSNIENVKPLYIGQFQIGAIKK